MSKLNELRQERAQLVKDMDELLKSIDDEKRDFSEEEEGTYTEMEERLESLDAAIVDAEEAEQRMSERKARVQKEIENGEKAEKRVIAPNVSIGKGPEGDFRDLGEFMHTVKANPSDNRLQEMRVQQMKDGTSGGFAIPTQFKPELLQVPVAPSVIRPRAMVIPAGDPADAEITMPALDQGANQNMYGGVTIYHQGESDQITESNASLKPVTMKPKKMTGYLTASNELLNNWSAASAVYPRLMRSAMDGAEDTDFFSGDGVNKSMGVMNANAAIDISRTTANQIAWADVYGMLARLRRIGTGSPVWIASQTIIPQLVQIADASSRAIWMPNAAADQPSSLYGIPVIFHERSPALGSKGDLVLADLGAYLVKDGSGPFVNYSEHYRFQNDEGAFRITWRVDGQPWLNEAIPLEGSTSNTVSPFVVLN